MTAPVAPVPSPRILTGDEWEAAQYAPHRVADDPTKPMGAGRILTGDEWEKAQSASSLSTLKLPAMPKFAADATSRINPNAGPVDRSIPEQVGGKVRDLAAGFDAAALGLDPTSAASARVIAALGRQAVAPAVEHPLLTAALANPIGAVIGTGMAVHTIAQYGWQKAHELGMSEEDRAKAEADPNRISGEAAAVQAVMLGLGTLAGVKAIRTAADFSDGMLEAGVQGVHEAVGGQDFHPRPIAAAEDAFNTERLQREVNARNEAARQTDAMRARINTENAARRDAEAAAEAARQRTDADIAANMVTSRIAEDLRQEELTRQAALRALTGVRRRPAATVEEARAADAARVAHETTTPANYFESPQGAEVLGRVAATKGLPETASPYVPGSAEDVAWKQGHTATSEQFPEGFTMGGALTENRIPSDYTPPKLPKREPSPSEYAPTGKTVPSIPIRNETGALERNLGRVATEDLRAEWQKLAEQNNTEEAQYRAVLEAPYRADYEALPSFEKTGRSRRQFDEFGNRVKQQAEDLPDAGGTIDPEQLLADNKIVKEYESPRAKLAREARFKAMTRIEAELAKRPDEAPNFPAQSDAYFGGEFGRRPLEIEGTGDVRTRGLSASVEQRAIAKDVTDYLGDLPEYKTVNMADQADRASQLLESDPELARKIALGDEPPPRGLLPEAVFKVVERKALEDGDVATLRDLASGNLTTEATTMGQRIRALADRDPNSPVTAIQKITDLRGGAKNAAESIAATTDELKGVWDEAAGVDVGGWEKFLETIKC